MQTEMEQTNQLKDVMIDHLTKKIETMKNRHEQLNRRKNRSHSNNSKLVTNTVQNLKNLRKAYQNLQDENYKMKNELIMAKEIIENMEDQLGV